METAPSVIAEIYPEASQFRHVRLHLYNAAERWQQVDPEIPSPPADRICPVRARCPVCAKVPFKRQPIWDRFDDCDPRCKARVLAHHDTYYEPAYKRAFDSATEKQRFGQNLVGSGWTFVGSFGVVVGVSGSRTEARVQTAYRVTPVGMVDPSRDEFFEAALFKLEDKTGWERT